MAKNIFGTVALEEQTLAKQVAGCIAISADMANSFQVTLVGLVCHAALHGNVTLLNKLDAGVSKGDYTPIQRASMRKWATGDDMPVAWSPGDKTKGINPGFVYSKRKANLLKDRLEKDKEATINALMAKPWYEARQEVSEFSGWDLQKRIDSLIKSAERMMEEHPELVNSNAKNAVKVDRRMLDKLRAMSTSKAHVTGENVAVH